LKKLTPMSVGYNLVEAKLLGKEYEEIKEKMSVIEFLRKLKNKEPINKAVAIIGFEDILLTGDGTATYIRRMLTESASRLRNHIIQIPIRGELLLDREPKIKAKSKEIRLTPIFGVKLIVKAPGYFYSPIYI